MMIKLQHNKMTTSVPIPLIKIMIHPDTVMKTKWCDTFLKIDTSCSIPEIMMINTPCPWKKIIWNNLLMREIWGGCQIDQLL